MSTVSPTDKVLVNRAGIDYSKSADSLMADILDTDHLLVNRGGVDYKCTGVDFKKAMKPPATINKPSIIAPADDAGITDPSTAVGSSGLVLTASAFASTPAGALTQTAASWEVAAYADTTFASPVAQVLNSTTDLTSWTVTPELAKDTQYRCRVKYISGATESPWSDVSTFKTLQPSANATISPGILYTLSTQTASGPGVPPLTALPANSDNTKYIDVCACADNTPALLLDTNNSLWVVLASYAAPAKSNVPVIGKIIKIAGGYLPNYYGNALALTDAGELWRGWNLANGGGSWAKVTLSFPSSEIVDLYSQAYCDVKGVLVERKTSTGAEWYQVPSNAQTLGTPVRVGPVGAKQVVYSQPYSTATPIWIESDGTLGGGATDPGTKYSKLICGGHTTAEVIGLTTDRRLKFVMGTSAPNVIPLPAGETTAKDLIMTSAYATRSFLLGGSGKVYITSASAQPPGLLSATWLEMTDLKDKYPTFGTLSSQAPIIVDRFNLIVPD